MNVIILRLHELTKAQLLAYGAWLRDEIRPDDKEVGSDWVCQARQQPHFWDDEHMAKMAEKHHGDDEDTMDIWVGLLDGAPVCTSWSCRGRDDRDLTLFHTDSSHTPAERFEIADEMALFTTKTILDGNHPAKRDFTSLLPENSEAAAYAKLCGFKITLIETTSIIPNPRPLARGRVDMHVLLDLVQKRIEARAWRP